MSRSLFEEHDEKDYEKDTKDHDQLEQQFPPQSEYLKTYDQTICVQYLFFSNGQDSVSENISNDQIPLANTERQAVNLQQLLYQLSLNPNNNHRQNNQRIMEEELYSNQFQDLIEFKQQFRNMQLNEDNIGLRRVKKEKAQMIYKKEIKSYRIEPLRKKQIIKKYIKRDKHKKIDIKVQN